MKIIEYGIMLKRFHNFIHSFWENDETLFYFDKMFTNWWNGLDNVETKQINAKTKWQKVHSTVRHYSLVTAKDMQTPPHSSKVAI